MQRWDRFLRVLLAIGVVCAVLLLLMLAWATTSSSRLEEYYGVLLGLNVTVAIALFAWVLVRSARLWLQYKRQEFGSKLTSRFAFAFALVGVVPGLLIYLLSVQFLSRSIESWFNVRVDTALTSGLSLARAALDSQLKELTVKARTMSIDVSLSNEKNLELLLIKLREQAGVDEVVIFTKEGQVIAQTSGFFNKKVVSIPSYVLSELKENASYSRTEVVPKVKKEGVDSLRSRAIVPVMLSRNGTNKETYYLQLLSLVPEEIAFNASRIEQGNRDYQELSLARSGLRQLYSMTLTLALLLAVFAAIGAALYLSRRFVKPLLTFAEGTMAVGGGDYRSLPDTYSQDELGQLTTSFNLMTKQLSEARSLVETNREQLERSNAYLESILSNLSSGVLVFDHEFRVTMLNQGAQQILREDLGQVIGHSLETVESLHHFAKAIRDAFAQHRATGATTSHWQQQLELGALEERAELAKSEEVLTILMRGSYFDLGGNAEGYVVVFDDMTEVISANRIVAWGEVARRLAHEIKNPLTPIQLSAERMVHKLAGKLTGSDADILHRLTTTIINQVSSLIHMVDDFREYARKPAVSFQAVNLNELAEEVLTLYGWDVNEGILLQSGRKIPLVVNLQAGLPCVYGDLTQLRQVIHNLLANASDAIEEKYTSVAAFSDDSILVQTQLLKSRWVDGSEHEAVRLQVLDSGAGFPKRVLGRAFEPYVTTKSKGTGLGLAIVKKIIDEHQGKIELTNREVGGASVSIIFTRLVETEQGSVSFNNDTKSV